MNAEENAIQTFKNHTIASLSTCDEIFSSVLWCKLIKQAQENFNMFRTSNTHPKLSAYHVLEGPNDFNRVPFAQPGCWARMLNPPETQTIWGPRAINAWYCSPAYEHYIVWKFLIPSTGRFQNSAQETFYPQHCTMPNETTMDTTSKTATTLTGAIKKHVK